MRANVMACELVRGTRLDHGALYGYCTGLVADERDKSTLGQKRLFAIGLFPSQLVKSTTLESTSFAT